MSQLFIKEFVDIEGHQNGMFIESTDFSNPVLLFLHGGPGFPQYASIENSGLAWEKYFTVCYWEQRGTGMSFNRSTQGELTLERLVVDTIASHKFFKGKISTR